jgi:hypothetical protein
MCVGFGSIQSKPENTTQKSLNKKKNAKLSSRYNVEAASKHVSLKLSAVLQALDREKKALHLSTSLVP